MAFHQACCSYLTENVRIADLVESVRHGWQAVGVVGLGDLVQFVVVNADFQAFVYDLRFGRRRPLGVAVLQLAALEQLVHSGLQQVAVLVGQSRDLEHRIPVVRLDGEMAEVAHRVLPELLDEHVLVRTDQADLRSSQ